MHKIKHYLFEKPRIWKYRALSDIREIDGKANMRQPVLFTGKGKVIIGDGVVIGVRRSPFFYSGYSYIEAREENALIKIGDGVWTNNNLVIFCNSSTVVIGHDTLIGFNVQIMDCDFHTIDPSLRKKGKGLSAPVRIDSNVWIGANVSILKGVSIGCNSIIANGSIVSESIPENVIAGGVPAKVIRSI